MRVCVFRNPTAGKGHSLDQLVETITAAGHRIVRTIERSADLRAHLDGVDAVVAAGGDGTIARAASALVGGDIPLAILPLGTANNIAASVGQNRALEALIGGWRLDRTVRIDVGFVERDGQESCFIESVGAGLVTECIAEARTTISKDDPDTHLEEARDLYLDMLSRLAPQRHSLVVDGEALSADYLLVEVLNTPRVGPAIELTEHVTVADRLLSVVCATVEDRAQLEQYLVALRRGSTEPAGFKSWRARTIEMTGVTKVHIDDRVQAVGGPVKIRIEPASLLVLA